MPQTKVRRLFGEPVVGLFVRLLVWLLLLLLGMGLLEQLLVVLRGLRSAFVLPKFRLFDLLVLLRRRKLVGLLVLMLQRMFDLQFEPL